MYGDPKCVICGDPVSTYGKGNFISNQIRSGRVVAICNTRTKPECARARKTQLQRELRANRREARVVADLQDAMTKLKPVRQPRHTRSTVPRLAMDCPEAFDPEKPR